MPKFLAISKSYPESEVSKGSWQFYSILGLIANVAIWSSALLYLKLTSPTYTSLSAISLPGEGSSTTVNLPNIGQASYENSSPYAITTQDPRENYKFVAESEPVLEAAASQLNMPLKKFGKPRIKILDNTTIMEVTFKGASPEEARNKSLAFYQVFEARLNYLRSQELIRRDAGFQAALVSSQRKLEIAQQRLSNYKARSGLNSSDQIKDLSYNIEQLRKQRAEIIAQQQQASSRLRQLSFSLNLSAQEAADAFVLQTDQIFQQNLKDYSEANAGLDVLNSKFLPNAPIVIEQKAKRDAAQKALLTRSQFLLGRSLSQASLRQLNLSSTKFDSARDNLFQELITAQAEQQGLQSQAQAMDRQIARLENRLKKLTQQESTLENMKRDVQLAEAVLSSTLTKLDIGKSNIFGSYPFIQMVIKPTLPKTPSWPKEEFVLIGTALCSLFVNTGLVLHWLRQYKTSTRVRPYTHNPQEYD